MKRIIIIAISGIVLAAAAGHAQTLQTVTDNGGNTTTNAITISPSVTATVANTVAPALNLNPNYSRVGPVSVIADFNSVDGVAKTYTSIYPASVTGSGTGLMVSITVASASPRIATVAIVNAGTGYNVGDVLSIPRSAVGSATAGSYLLYVGNVNATASFSVNNAPFIINGYSQGHSYQGAFTPMMNFSATFKNGSPAVSHPAAFGYYFKTSQNPFWSFLFNGTYALGISGTTGVDIPLLNATRANIDFINTGYINNSNGYMIISGTTNSSYLDNSVKFYGNTAVTGSSFAANSTIVSGAVTTLNITNAGSGYAPGTYSNLKATGGSGSGLYITVIVGSAGTVTNAVVANGISYAGQNYAQNETVSAPLSGGTGFAATINLRTNHNFSALVNVSTFKTKTADTFFTVKSIPNISQETGATGNVYGFFHDPRITSLLGKNIAFQNITGDVYMGTTSGNVGIGTSNPTQKLSVAGTILAKRVKASVAKENWPDYVFASDYQLPSLEQVDAYIKQNQHLPEVPSADAVSKQGLDVGDSQALLLKKIEELTLYLIDQNEKIKAQGERIKKLEEKKAIGVVR
ncbi:hypothetical protein SAMN05421788_103467 [Filimonas lacunae]|uniref:Chaperone of endosialidase n=1 Tax=Filimonas lacunae TaxID=477680 RepID=A0A173ML61_9BACT|nr:hypothetical protein [Filimonas lacunae]BAV08131.1 hypothetical protein FLA_4164 [Filimonas lacunae]SIT09739.1 hypothetical protein SAMN05421788_103467 [Filimonas lacunae]